MIRIKSLTKIYKSRRKSRCHALKGIDLTLPDTGLVFVLGKSGSGKSTLLNLIGGLDSITAGGICVDGNEIASFREGQFTNYRNNHIGFIFQDYHLIDEMTVQENVEIALRLRTEKDSGKVAEALERVGLDGYQNRFPSELSGGERQRVAIARAIVKSPRMVLADEPTGNLDPKTATTIMQILKELSRSCLVLVVSHNTNDADRYADRIIELSHGEIISDYCKNPTYDGELHVDGGTLYYPMDRLLSEEDVTHLNAHLRDGEIGRVVRRTDKFRKTDETEWETENETQTRIRNNNLTPGGILSLSLRFLKRQVPRILLSGFMVAVILVCLSLGQTIVDFRANDVISTYMKDNDLSSMLLEKRLPKEYDEIYGKSYLGVVTEEDLKTIREAGYTGAIYPILNHGLSIATSSHSAMSYRQFFQNGFYAVESIGTMIVDMNFLVKKFGDVSFLVEAEEYHPLGVYITDYMADSILKNNSYYSQKNATYEDLLGIYHYNGHKGCKRGYINGIIETGYRERYAELIENYEGKQYANPNDLWKDADFQAFSEEVYDRMGFCYSLNPNFKEDFLQQMDAGEEMLIESVFPHKICFDDKIDIIMVTGANYAVWYDSADKYHLGENEVVMNANVYNQLFGTRYTDQTAKNFVPHTIKLTQYHCGDIEKKVPLQTIEVYVKALGPGGNYTFLAGKTLYRKFAEHYIQTTDLYFDDSEQISTVLSVTADMHYENQNFAVEGIHTMTKAVDVFIPIFDMINYVLCLGVVLILMNFAMKMIKDKMHEIGILKALGMKNSTVGIIFGLQIGLIASLTAVMSTIGYRVFIRQANDVLVASLRKLAPSSVVPDLDFLIFKSSIAWQNVLLIVLLTLVAFVLPMLRIRRIKPVQIIRSRE